MSARQWIRPVAGPSSMSCGAAIVLIVGLAVLVEITHESEPRGAALVGSVVLVALGALVGSVWMAALGVAVMGATATVVDAPTAVIVVTGVAGLFIMLLVDAAISARRAARVDHSVWLGVGQSAAMAALLSLVITGIAVSVANMTTWQAITVPVGVLAIGLAIRSGADLVARRARG